jgi:hypothetical protein
MTVLDHEMVEQNSPGALALGYAARGTRSERTTDG